MSRERILVVDDEGCIREVVCSMLECTGYQCTQASSGGEALAKLEAEGEFDLMLSDLMMPGLDGIELLERAGQKFPHMPAVLMTAAACTAGLDAVESKGCSYLLKPFSREQLLDALRRSLKESRPRQ